MPADKPFDVADYVRRPIGPMRPALGGVGTALPDDLAEALRYLQRRAQGTTSWLSNVLVTATHKDARITAFLSTWAYERHWIGEAVGALAGEGGAFVERRRSALRRLHERFGPLREAILGNLHGRRLTAVHMAERLVDGWIVEAMIERAQAIAPAAVAADLLAIREGIARQGRFFAESATEALAGSRAARALARRRLRRRAWPIGADREPASTAAALRTLFGADRGWAAAIDRRIDGLPGLRGLALAGNAASRPGRRPLRTATRAVTRPLPERKDGTR